jgi:transcriptional regulator with XRE-family HTH domain
VLVGSVFAPTSAPGSELHDCRRGLTQEALALEAGMSRNVLIEVEHGRIGLLYERLFDIAAVLDVEVSNLIEG